jgi:heme oxygenase (mycobilin-producing)
MLMSVVPRHLGDKRMSKVIVINPFEIPEGMEKSFLQLWELIAKYMRRQPGFISTRLHRAMSQDAKFVFVHIAEWESEELLQSAIEKGELKRLTEPYLKVFSFYPALYELIRSYEHKAPNSSDVEPSK